MQVTQVSTPLPNTFSLYGVGAYAYVRDMEWKSLILQRGTTQFGVWRPGEGRHGGRYT